MASGDAIGGPRYFRYDCNREVHEGDWLVQKSPATECGERWYTVLAARPVAVRSRIKTAYRWSTTAQERRAPTSADPSIPLDYPRELGQVHFFAWKPRNRWRQTR